MPVHRHPFAVSRHGASLSAVPLDASLASRLRGTYQLVRERDTELADTFYAKLFAAAPALRSMFKGEPQAQSGKLMAALDAVVRNFEDPAANAEMLAALGKRHAAYGARPEHYELVIELLVSSMRELLGAAAVTQRLAEWKMALTLISEHMIAAAES
jgi:hemoglobin-like flavoprotein